MVSQSSNTNCSLGLWHLTDSVVLSYISLLKSTHTTSKLLKPLKSQRRSRNLGVHPRIIIVPVLLSLSASWSRLLKFEMSSSLGEAGGPVFTQVDASLFHFSLLCIVFLTLYVSGKSQVKV